MQGVRPYMLISEKNWWLRLHRFGLKSRRDDLFIEDADATQFFFLLSSGPAPLKNKKKIISGGSKL
jgi:hypothetical protein